MSDTSSFENVALSYNNQMGENGDFNHATNLDPSIFRLLGDVKNSTIYDLGCGNGYLGFKLLEMGAGKVYGSDISPSLVEFAKNKSQAENITNIHFNINDGGDFSEFDGLENTFDSIISNVAMHYIQDLDKVVEGANKILIKGGKFIFTVAHPIDDFALNKELPRNELVSIAESYLQPYSHTVYWGKDNPIIIYKRPISYYVSVFSSHGFALTGMEELPKVYMDNDKVLQKTKLPGFITYCFTKI